MLNIVPRRPLGNKIYCSAKKILYYEKSTMSDVSCISGLVGRLEIPEMIIG
jgi:hypothetical protein